MFAPTFHCLLAQGAAACPQCVWNEVLAGLIEEDARPIALMALVINPLSNFCSFAGPLQDGKSVRKLFTQSLALLFLLWQLCYRQIYVHAEVPQL